MLDWQRREDAYPTPSLVAKEGGTRQILQRSCVVLSLCGKNRIENDYI
jgi:hypothetical protein